MTVLFGIIAVAAVLFLLGYILKTRKMVRDLKDAVQAERRLLLEGESKRLQTLGFYGLVDSINKLVDRYNTYAVESSGYSNQVEAMLGSIQEAVLIFDSTRRTIEFANESAQRLFQHGRLLKGARLESALRSTSLLEFLKAPRNNEDTTRSEITLERRGEELWFEISCAQVRGIGNEGTSSTLLVMHDITRLKSLEMVRRDFVANVSHELRTPLTIIKGFAETLVEDNATLPVEARARFLDKIVNNAERLHVLVEDLLTLSRLESKPDQFDPTAHSLRQLFEDTLENYKTRLDESSQRMELEYDERVGDFAFDRFRINQVVDNLVENAFRYAPDFSLLKLKVVYEESEKMVLCSVQDDGPGIPEKDVEHIFERFYRVDKGRSRETGGTGLGLSIMKHIVQLHGGRVYAESAEGEGTIIHFSLPYRAAAGK